MLHLRKTSLLILFLLCSGLVFAQQKFEVLGSPDAIVLDMTIEESKKYVIASTPVEVQVWNYEMKSLLKTWSQQGVLSLELNDNMLAGISKSGNLFIWNIESGQELYNHKITPASLLCLAWLDSVWIAVGSDDGTMYKVNVQTGEISNTIKSKGSITTMAKNYRGVLFVGNSKGELKIYDAASFNLNSTVHAHKSWIKEIHVADSSEYFMTVSESGTFKQWRYPTLEESSTRFSNSWLNSADSYSEKGEKAISIWAAGKLNGYIIFKTQFGNYTAQSNAAINKIVMVKSALPSIKAIVATHGGGIQLWKAKDMKFKN